MTTFLRQLGKIVNTGQTRSVLLTGNIHDLFYDRNEYVPLIDFLTSKLKVEAVKGQNKGIVPVVYRVNRPIEITNYDYESLIDSIFVKKYGSKGELKRLLQESNENSVLAFELMKELTETSRISRMDNDLLVIVEAADMLLPESEISRMGPADRRRVGIVHDWLTNPKFMDGHDTVVLLADSRASVHHRISRLPNVLSVDIPLPNLEQRLNFICHFASEKGLAIEAKHIADQTAGLSLHAIRQLLCSGDYSLNNIALKVEEYMVSQLGEGVVEFKRPTHRIDSVIGNSLVKRFFKEELIPSFYSKNKTGVSGVAVAGPIGSGKTFLCEAFASEIGIPVIVLKNIRSKWFGETDQIFERLRRLLESFHKIVIFVDEADAMFGDIQSDHDTERRLTGKIQGMMSDPDLKGRIIWFLMTARIHRLSPDIRRPGRMDLILPILDPEGEDQKEFILWALGEIQPSEREMQELLHCTQGYSAASYSLLRNRILQSGCKTVDEVIHIAEDIVLPDIRETREYQTLQAKLNCTRLSLISKKTRGAFELERSEWKKRILELERMGIQ